MRAPRTARAATSGGAVRARRFDRTTHLTLAPEPGHDVVRTLALCPPVIAASYGRPRPSPSLPTPVQADHDPDREIVDRFRAGDLSAFGELVRRHQRGVWRLVRRYVRSDADAASDVSQLTFVRAYRGLASYRGEVRARSWLYKIAINCALSWLRDHRRDRDTVAPTDAAAVDDSGGPIGAVVAVEDARRLRAAIHQLPPKQKLVLELRVFDELSFKEVAELAECSENSAKVNFHHAVARLRELLGGHHGRT